eukprot:TRINITY_DN4908_c0_g1_i2.p1 TRINITY_DN4908_c0_g1~~TRINITY_DN4908_c0_g1_i2.p1  ORF type:complete len:610 (-),score=65.21 TRINITY_DN4908_c0_g1_i2:192-2021(-)
MPSWMEPLGSSTELRADVWGSAVCPLELPSLPLHIAAWKKGSTAVHDELVKGALVNQTGHMGETALHWAAAAGDEAAVHELVLFKANVAAASASPFVRFGDWQVGRVTALHWAASGGHSATIRKLIEASAEVSAVSSADETALHCAAYCGSPSAVFALIEAGADVQAKASDGDTALHRVCDSRSDEAALRLIQNDAVRVLIQNSANVRATANNGDTALHRAGRRGNDAAVRTLLENGANVRATTKDGDTALHWASDSGCAAAVQSMLEYGAVVSAVGRRGTTALHRASDATYGHRKTAAVDVLLSRGADRGVRDDLLRVPLHFAAMRGYLPVVSSLLHGARPDGGAASGIASRSAPPVRTLPLPAPHVNAADKDGSTPLHFAVTGLHASVVDALLRCGAHPAPLNDTLDTPLCVAAALGSSKIMDMLGTEHPPTANRTPLHAAVTGGWVDLLAKPQLLSFINVKNKAGFLPLHLATGGGQTDMNADVVEALVKLGADVDCLDKNGRTPLFFALRWLDDAMKEAQLESVDKDRRLDKDMRVAVLGFQRRRSGTVDGLTHIPSGMAASVRILCADFSVRGAVPAVRWCKTQARELPQRCDVPAHPGKCPNP